MSMSSDSDASADQGKARQKRAEEAMYADVNSASASGFGAHGVAISVSQDFGQHACRREGRQK